ncbi:hypothetical protein [uncultured Tessaracoccus sp.]|uniref:LpxL/LpxP family acyltransferase n=1 Tax=uncultured Tessaracoccus sp. TaxID=905023 RepID=UPI0025F5A5A8|nr:hypothetical protein [uncultured Tessaracoccus sp.]
MAGLRTRLLWGLGSRLSRRSADRLARWLAPVLALLPLPAVRAWESTVRLATGRRGRRRALLEHWLRNALWSLSLPNWDADELRAVARIDDADVAKLHASLAGPGLVLALPHMGSWDFAGAWCATQGIEVVSVAERLPDGLYERFRRARAEMGMRIHPIDRPQLVSVLAGEVRAGRMVCLLADRVFGRHGVDVPWPGTDRTLRVPAGPAVVARRTGADLRAVTIWFDGDHLVMTVSDVITGDTAEDLLAGCVETFADGVRRRPESWLMLRSVLR